MRIAVPDLVSNSYFPAVAAIELGFFRAQGMDVELEMVFPVGRALEALRDRRVDFVAGPAHATLSAFPGWQGAKLLVALSQHTFWLLVLRSDLEVRPGDVAAVKGLRIGAAPGPDTALRRLLAEAGVDPAADDVALAPVPGSGDAGVPSASMPPEPWRRGQSTGSGPTRWEPKWRCGVGSAAWCLTRGEAWVRRRRRTLPSRRWSPPAG